MKKLLFVLTILGGLFMSQANAESLKMTLKDGDVIIKLRPDLAPNHVKRIKELTEQGFYDGIVFHRVIDGFMAQTGDPTGTGMGGPGYSIEDEFVKGHSNSAGTIAMANSGPNSGGSQFFINLVDNEYLDWDKHPSSSKHPVFGEVVKGMDIVEKIGLVAVNGQAKPLEEVKIIKASIL